eukprot:1491650-Rhodomonas_salina.2
MERCCVPVPDIAYKLCRTHQTRCRHRTSRRKGIAQYALSQYQASHDTLCQYRTSHSKGIPRCVITTVPDTVEFA